MEGQHGGSSAPDTPLGDLFLLLSQCVCLLSLAVTPIWTVWSLVAMDQIESVAAPRSAPAQGEPATGRAAAEVGGARLRIVLSGAVGFVLSGGLATVFGRVRGLRPRPGPATEQGSRRPYGEAARPPERAAGRRDPGGVLALAVADARAILGGWVLVECDDGGWAVPPLRDGQPVEFQWADGRALPARVAGEESHIRSRRPGRVGFTLAGPIGLADVAGATEVRIPLLHPAEPGATADRGPPGE